jgi:peptide/nickel transport system permease protein
MSKTDIEYASQSETYGGMQFGIAAAINYIIAIGAFLFGGLILVGNFVGVIITAMGGTPDLPAYVPLLLIHALVAVVIGYIVFRAGLAIQDQFMWAFTTSLYSNIILVVLYLILGPPGIPLMALSLLGILALFQSDVRTYWYPSFKEDMTPRVKEIRYSLYLVRKSPLVVVGIIILVTFVALAFLAPYIAPYGPEQRIWADSNLPPGSPSTEEGMPFHFWGTDDSGGDIFSRIIYAAQTDLRVSVTVVIVAVIVGTTIGAIAGYYGGKIDEVVMRVTDVFFAFPGLVLSMAIVMALGSRSLGNISIALMVTWWPAYARLVRGQVLGEREKLYVEAARSVGASDSRILAYHIIPNTIQPLIVQATMDTGSVLLVAAGLSFIGFGPPAGVAEWGLMISIAQNYFTVAPWAVFFPGFAILLTALAFNLVGDGIRDILDPRIRRR